MNKKKTTIIISAIVVIVLALIIGLIVFGGKDNKSKDKEQTTTTEQQESTSEKESSTEKESENLTEQETEKEEPTTEEPTTISQLPPEQRPAIGEYEEEYKGDFFYQRTYDNGAIRYYYFSSETRLFYEIDEIGIIPEAVKAQIQKDIKDLGLEEPTTASMGEGGASSGGSTNSANSSNNNNSSSSTEPTTETEIDDPFGNVDNRTPGEVPPEDWEGLEGGVVGDDGEIIGD